MTHRSDGRTFGGSGAAPGPTPGPFGPVRAAAPDGRPGDTEPAPEPGTDPDAQVRERLAAAVRGLDGLAELAVSDHVERYDVLNGELQDALASIDEV